MDTTGKEDKGKPRDRLVNDLSNDLRNWIKKIRNRADWHNLVEIPINGCRVTEEDVGLGGLAITCSPRDPRFAGSNPAEVDGFFRTYKS